MFIKLLFISQYPSKENERDGMIQRIKMIDDIFSDDERVYLDLSFSNNLKSEVSNPQNKVQVYKYNCIIHAFFIIRLLLQAKIVFVHSVYNYCKILPFCLSNKIFIDLHGTVPEEWAYRKKIAWSFFFKVIEFIAVHKSHTIINLSNSMAAHICNKYQLANTKMITLPMFDANSVKPYKDGLSSAKPVVIYAGGISKWQNIDLMIEAIKMTNDRYRFIILTNNIAVFSNKLDEYGLNADVTLLSVPQSEVYQYYAKADLGFILRDDHLLNRVACPAKLIEYLSKGVVPVVLCPLIGDFAELGFSYVTLDQLYNGESITDEKLSIMRENNYKIIDQLRCSASVAMQNLRKVITCM